MSISDGDTEPANKSQEANIDAEIQDLTLKLRMMAEMFPQRRSELDCYEGILVDLNNTHGNVF